MKRTKFIIVGLGNVGQELLEKLSRDFEIVCVDSDAEAEEKAKKTRGENSRVIKGDATSRLVLEEAGVDDADAVIITTTEEKINIEVARVLKDHFNPKRIISVGSTKDGIAALEALGVEVQNIFATSAIGIRNTIEHKTRTPHAIGLGKNEILEVEVHPSSRLANRSLANLTPVRWRIGIIYRDGNIVIPRSDTVLKAKDKVLILGDPAVLKTVSEILTFSFQQFPLEYGSTVIAYLTGREDENYFRELEYLLSVFSLRKVVFIQSKNAVARADSFKGLLSGFNLKDTEIKSTSLSPYGAIEGTLMENKGEYGLIMLSRQAMIGSPRYFIPGLWRKNFLIRLSYAAECPVLLSSGTFPYEKTVTPCVEGLDLQHVLETALEISSSLNNEVTALLVNPSRYISTVEEHEHFKIIKKTVSEMSLMYRTSVNTLVLNGNPVKAVGSVLQDYNLLIADTGGWKKPGWISGVFNPDVVWHIVGKAAISTLLIPPVKESI